MYLCKDNGINNTGNIKFFLKVMWARHGRSYDESDYLINLSEDANIINDGKGVHRTKLII